MQIQVFQLMNGVEIIGRTDEKESGDKITVDKPLRVHLMPHEKGLHLDLLPFSFVSSDTNINLNRSALVADPYSPTQEVEKSYIQQTSNIYVGNEQELKALSQ